MGMSIGFILIDARNRVVWLNRAAERLLGRPTEDCLGRSFDRVARDPHLAEFWRDSGCNTGNCVANISVRWPQPLELKLNATHCTGPDGREIGRALLFCDVTSDHSVQMALTAEVASRLMHLADGGEAPSERVANLTSAERRTLRLLGRGLTNDAIAEELGVAASTVRSHLKHLYRKLGLRTRAAAASFAVRQRLA